MIALDEQAAAIAASLDQSLTIVGAAGTGKTYALVRRAIRAASAGPVLLLAPSDGGVRRARTALAEALRDDAAAGVRCASFGEIAFEIVCGARADAVDEIDDARASQHFERAGAELFALEWTEFVGAQIDPEITGLRAPERFSAAAFRLIRKLRAALVSPEAFRTAALKGATNFYGKPPNFAAADLIMETPAKYRDSLRVSAAELERQRGREIDLAKILAHLYASYVETLVTNGCLTATDAVYEAVAFLRDGPAAARAVAARYGGAFVDDAQDLTAAQLALLEAIFGAPLRNVTLAGDAAQATRGFATGARGADALARTSRTVTLVRPRRCEPAIERAALLALDPQALREPLAPGVARDTVRLYRASDLRDEARYVASEIRGLIAAGLAPERITVVTRNLRCAHGFADALLARDVPVDVAGAASLYEFPVVQDALSALWAAVDPFRHDRLLRNFEAPWLRLCDASIATLCGDAADPQPLLFPLPEGDGEERAARWDGRRALRLGRNLTRGDVDAELPADARARVVAFRAARERWEAVSRTLPLGELVRLVLAETVLAVAGDDARGRFERHAIARLIDDVDAFEARRPLGTLDDFLAHAETIAETEADLLAIAPRDPQAVRLLDVEAAKGETFDAVFLVDVRAGAWPRYYVPDAFLFSPSTGMIPKDNVGDASAARTAKFTYAMFRQKFREKYNLEERRAFYTAATRARKILSVSASGRPTRGVSAPEIFEELRRLTES